MLLPSSLDKIDQLLIQKVPLNITCKIDFDFDFGTQHHFYQAITPNKKQPPQQSLVPFAYAKNL
jgi:hypothetical protein